MSEEVTASLSDTTPTEPAAPAETAPAPAPVDNSKIFSKGYNEGIEKGAERAKAELLASLGVGSLEEVKLAKPEVVNSVKAQNEERAKLIEQQQAEINAMKQAQAEQALDMNIQQSFDALKVQPKKASTVMSEIRSTFDFQTKDGQTRVYQKGTETPIMDSAGNFASVQQAVELFTKDNSNTWLFNSAINGHINNSTPGSNELPKNFLKNQDNVHALKATGQLNAALSGQAVNMSLVNQFLQGDRKNGAMTLIK